MTCWISSTRSRRHAVTGEAKGHQLKAAKTTATPSHSRLGEDGALRRSLAACGKQRIGISGCDFLRRLSTRSY